MISTQKKALHISHIPCHFMQEPSNISENKVNYLIAHVSNSHPIVRKLAASRKDNDNCKNSVSVNLIFHGEQAYISPNNVAIENRAAHKVPTWNYSKVHVTAQASEVLNRDEKYTLMEQSTNYFERTHDNPWLLTDCT